VLSRLVVLGSCGAWPEAGRACSGYVLEHAGTRVVLDLGYGTLPRLLTLLTSVFAARPLPAEPYRVGAVSLQAWSLPHHVTNVGVRLSAPGLTVAYTGDTGPDLALAELGRDADLYIVEATDRHQQPGVAPAPAGPALDLTAREAGEAAAAAGARRLLLTHFWPGNDRELSRADARQTYGGDVQLAEEGLVITLP